VAISSFGMESMPAAYSSRTAACAFSLSLKSFRLADSNSCAADLEAAARFRSRASSCMSVLNGVEVLAAFVVSARIPRRTSSLRT
jgi:hypothetical protein